jgi:cobalt/nickel transport system permease protein
MAFYGCFIGGMFIWKHMIRKEISKKRIVAASIIGSVLTLQLGAVSVTLETLASGITELPFSIFLAAMQPIHLAIGLVEGLITAAVLAFLYEVRPELLWCGERKQEKENRLSYRGTIGVLAVTAVVIGGLLSLAASTKPDGLEWSMERVAGTTELEAGGGVYTLAEKIQSVTSLLPDYTWKKGEAVSGTMFSGIVGGFLVLTVCVGGCYLLKYLQRRKRIRREMRKSDE